MVFQLRVESNERHSITFVLYQVDLYATPIMSLLCIYKQEIPYHQQTIIEPYSMHTNYQADVNTHTGSSLATQMTFHTRDAVIRPVQ